LPDVRQWICATEFATSLGVLSGYQRKIIPSGDWSSVQGGPLQAARQSKIAIPAARIADFGIDRITAFGSTFAN
jgi:hypothetical protein